MPFRLLQFTLATLCLSLFSGCQVSVNESNISVQEESQVLEDESFNEDVESRRIFTQVSILTRGGFEVYVDHNQFSRMWHELITLQQKRAEAPDAPPSYTVLAWDHDSQPHVFHISEQSFKVDSWYQSEGMTDFLAWLKPIIGQNILVELQMDRMSVHAADIGTRTYVPQDIASKMFMYIKQAKPVQDDVPFISALYPHYTLNIEYGDKGYLTVVVVDSHTFLLQDGRDQWVYKVDQPIFSQLTSISPITVYSQSHIKSLYQSDDVYIQLDETYFYLKDSVQQDQLAKQWIHHLTRILSTGKQVNEEAIEEQKVLTPWTTLQFSHDNDSLRDVKIFEDYFIFEENYYYVSGLRKKLHSAFQFLNEK